MASNSIHKAPSRSRSAPRIDLSLTKTAAGPQTAGDDANWWMITLSDLTLLLLGFFVFWYMADKAKPAAVKAPAVAKPIAEQRLLPAMAPVQSGLEPEQWKEFQDEMKNVIGEAGLTQDVTVELSRNEILLSLKDTLPFDSGKADLRPQAFPVLEKVVVMLLNYPILSLEISGHTDSIPIATAEFPSNWELSSARASRVARYLTEKGIDPSRIAVQGYANHRPRMPDSSATSRSANRRVELRLYHSADKVSPQSSVASAP